MTGYVHNHGPEDWPGMACPEYRTADGTLRGRCLDLAERTPAYTPYPPHRADCAWPQRPCICDVYRSWPRPLTTSQAERCATLTQLRAAQRHGSTDRLMTWKTPRLPRAARVTLAYALAVLLTVAGVLVLEQLIADDALCVFAVVCWAFGLGCAALAYAQVVRR